MSFSSYDASTTMWPGFEDRYWIVHKFGGTSVASAECFQAVAQIVQQQAAATAYDEANDTTAPVHIAVVLSAMGGKPKVTDLLLDAVKYAAERDNAQVDRVLGLVLEKHAACLASLFPNDGPDGSSNTSSGSTALLDLISQDLNNIRDILKTVSLMKWPAQRISELVSGYGELWSTQILTKLLQKQQQQQQQQQQSSYNPCHWAYVDARRVITVDEEAIQDGVVVWDVSQEKLDQVYQEELGKISTSSDDVMKPILNLVVTGYVASNTHGVATTLQRDGSDYSAAIMGRLLRANCVSIWTDVDGVLSADPRRVPLAIVLPQVSYNEAMELAYFGAKVIHPKTMQPAITCQPQIPIYIRNTFAPHLPGTRIYVTATTGSSDRVVCGFSSIEQMALVNVEGSGMMGT
jgi:bifunctional aspartokinase / homoserine dehydrogenase 1